MQDEYKDRPLISNDLVTKDLEALSRLKKVDPAAYKNVRDIFDCVNAIGDVYVVLGDEKDGKVILVGKSKKDPKVDLKTDRGVPVEFLLLHYESEPKDEHGYTASERNAYGFEVKESSSDLDAEIEESEIVRKKWKQANKKGCFVATACYGSYESKEVKILRRFRDLYLESFGLGRFFVETYYKFGPSAADFLDTHPSIKGPIRGVVLGPIVKVTSLLLLFSGRNSLSSRNGCAKDQ